MRRKILLFSALLAAAAVIVTSALIIIVSYLDFYQTIKKEAITQTTYIRAGLELSGDDYLHQIGQQLGHRVTLIAADGTVLFDTVQSPEQMENHANRPEVAQALTEGSGESTRYSDTQHKQTFYYATRLEDGTVLRTATSIIAMLSSFQNLIWLTALIALLVVLIAIVVASRMTRRIVRPINKLDLEHPERNLAYEEINPLLARIKLQNEQIRQQMKALDRERLEFASITENMNEGFLVLDSNAHILSYNKSALRYLAAPEDEVLGQSVLVLNRSEQLRSAIQAALKGSPQDTVLALEQQYYQLLASPVRVEGAIQGVVVIVMDITEKHQREQLRREFTANVSHELKTPLTAISGYAEIMGGGMVKAEDMPGFAQNIYAEAQRLIALMRDLMFLSKLDEGNVSPERKPTDLWQLAQTVAARLEQPAQQKQVSLQVQGEPAIVRAIPSVLDEMVYNLLDNAIKYNQVGGSVTITISKNQQEAILSVADTGIGIAGVDQERVFERFYRADKSHSKTTPGTGLGLAIVKHGALLHHAKLTLESALGSGTTITLTFPLR